MKTGYTPTSTRSGSSSVVRPHTGQTEIELKILSKCSFGASAIVTDTTSPTSNPDIFTKSTLVVSRIRRCGIDDHAPSHSVRSSSIIDIKLASFVPLAKDVLFPTKIRRFESCTTLQTFLSPTARTLMPSLVSSRWRLKVKMRFASDRTAKSRPSAAKSGLSTYLLAAISAREIDGSEFDKNSFSHSFQFL